MDNGNLSLKLKRPYFKKKATEVRTTSFWQHAAVAACPTPERRAEHLSSFHSGTCTPGCGLWTAWLHIHLSASPLDWTIPQKHWELTYQQIPRVKWRPGILNILFQTIASANKKTHSTKTISWRTQFFEVKSISLQAWIWAEDGDLKEMKTIPPKFPQCHLTAGREQMVEVSLPK